MRAITVTRQLHDLAQVIGDPACGTGGFLLAAHDFISQHNKLDKAQRKHLKTEALWGTDIVPGVVSLCAMNMYLHGIGKVAEASSLSSEDKDQTRDASATLATIDRADALAQPSGRKFDMILANPPFGKKRRLHHRRRRWQDQHRETGIRARRVAA